MGRAARPGALRWTTVRRVGMRIAPCPEAFPTAPGVVDEAADARLPGTRAVHVLGVDLVFVGVFPPR